MTINKYQGKTKEEAIEKAKQELGQEAVVLNVKEMKQTGFFKFLKRFCLFYYKLSASVIII